MPKALSPVKPRSLVAQTIDLFRERIKSGEWPLGHRLPTEGMLAEALEVGRNTVREAIRVLSHAGVLEVRQGDGTYVRLTIDPAETIAQLHAGSLREHLELQCMLEAEAAAYAAQRRNDGDIARLNALLMHRGEFDNAEPTADLMQRDRAFHLALVQAAHNSALLSLYLFFSATIDNRLQYRLGDTGYAEPGLAAHVVIVDAIKQSDAGAASHAVRAIYTPLFEQLKAIAE